MSFLRLLPEGEDLPPTLFLLAPLNLQFVELPPDGIGIGLYVGEVPKRLPSLLQIRVEIGEGLLLRGDPTLELVQLGHGAADSCLMIGTDGDQKRNEHECGQCEGRD